VVVLTLNPNGTVQNLKDHTGQIKATYSYSGEYLTQVTYKDAAYGDSSLKYGWDKGRLRSLTDKNGTPYYLNYDDLNRIASVGEINMLGNPSLEAGYGSNLDSWQEKVTEDYGSITEDSSTAQSVKAVSTSKAVQRFIQVLTRAFSMWTKRFRLNPPQPTI